MIVKRPWWEQDSLTVTLSGSSVNMPRTSIKPGFIPSSSHVSLSAASIGFSPSSQTPPGKLLGEKQCHPLRHSVRLSVGRSAVPVLSLVSGEGPGSPGEQDVQLPATQEERDEDGGPPLPALRDTRLPRGQPSTDAGQGLAHIFGRFHAYHTKLHRYPTVTGLPLSAPAFTMTCTHSRFLHVTLVSAYDHVRGICYALVSSRSVDWSPGAVPVGLQQSRPA